MSYTDKLKVELYDEVVNEKNKQYIELSCRLRETCNDIKKKDKEIERLNTDKEQLNNLVNFNQKEIRRLNNIIDELEKWLKERSGDVSFAYHHTLNKLQELKGDDK